MVRESRSTKKDTAAKPAKEDERTAKVNVSEDSSDQKTDQLAVLVLDTKFTLSSEALPEEQLKKLSENILGELADLKYDFSGGANELIVEVNTKIFGENSDLLKEAGLTNEQSVVKPEIALKQESENRRSYRAAAELPDPDRSHRAEVNRKTKLVNFRLPPESIAELEVVAKLRNVPKATWLADVVTRALEEERILLNISRTFP